VTWLDSIRRVRAIAQTGQAYAKDPFDLERFTELGAIAENLLATLVGVTPAQVRDLYVPERGYPTPKVDVRAGVFRGDDILLVREVVDGRWSLPGGWADEQESPAESIVREVQEESGYQVRVVKLVAIKDRALHPYVPARLEHVYKLFFLCELLGGSAATSTETSAAVFFGELPPLSIGRTLPADIEMLYAHRRAPGLPTQFD
jgi:ADP-ribose pyrophosphatase YjhB (NUDIX family)